MRRDLIVLMVVVLLATVPFLNKPVHIDDTFVLRITEQILNQPMDPFGFEIDWFGHMLPAATATTNPPFISYWLAPIAAAAGFNEIALHLGMLPFYILWAWAAFRLFRRYAVEPWYPTLFLILSAPFLVSGNLMRDVPAASMVTAGLWLWLDEPGSPWRRRVGGLLIGLAVLAKYSVAVLVGVWVLRALWRRRRDELGLIWIPVCLMGAWCALTWWAYGIPHPLYLLLERSSSPGIVWQDKFFGSLVIIGSGLFLFPLFILQSLSIRRWRELGMVLVPTAAVSVWAYRFYGRPFDFEFQLWLAAGAVVLIYAMLPGPGRQQAFHPEQWFWAAWMLAPLLFSIFLVPFQAVRHLMPAMPPLLLLLSGRLFEAWSRPWSRRTLAALLGAQAAVAFAVHIADWEYAHSYREFARAAAARLDQERVWFVGHWGWKFYAEQSGFRQMHRDGPLPEPGDVLIWPEKVHTGSVFSRSGDLRERMQPIEATVYPGTVPVRTMSLDAKAGFYAVIRQRIPYRFHRSSPLEVMRVFRVVSQEPQADGVDGTNQ